MSAIVDFYAGKTVFVTGVSGFLGKITLEKLLRTCEVKKVYVLLREKKGKSPSERLEEIFDGPAFSNLRKSGTEFKSKVTLLPGDLKEPGLGLSPDDRRLLVENVEIVMHWAASINFHQNLKSATYTNVRSLREMIALAKEMTKLKAFLYVSTAYSNCHRTVLNEELYDFPVSGDNLIKIMDAVDEDMAAKLAPQLFSGSPNSYNFTKGAAEDLLKSEAGNLPICVLRPSIVIPTDTEPVPGYIDNMYGIIGITILIALGILRIVLCIKSLFAEIVPADFVMNAAFAATWDVARKREKDPKNREIPVFNFVLSNRYKLRIAEYVNYADTTCRFFPSEKCVWYPCYFFTSNRTLYKIGKVVLHYLPAYIGDFVFRCLGWKPLMVSGYRKIDTFADVLTYFTMRNWKFNDDKMWQLWDEMTSDDQKTFNFDLGKWTLDEYSPICAVGTRRYILKDPPETIPAGFRKYYKLMALHYVFVAVLTYLFYKLCSCLVAMVFY